MPHIERPIETAISTNKLAPQKSKHALHGLVAATFTPFSENGDLDLSSVRQQTPRLIAGGVEGLFVCGSTGEGPSMTLDERQAVLDATLEAAQGVVPVAAHVGHNCLRDAQELAAHAETRGAAAIASITPGFYKPASESVFVDYLVALAESAPKTPLYYYHFPGRVPSTLDLETIIALALERIPTFAGVKYTHTDFAELARIRNSFGSSAQILFGRDELFLKALDKGWHDFVGSTYNYANAIFVPLRKAFQSGDRKTAEALQACVDDLLELLIQLPPISGQKVLLECVGLSSGPVRLPLRNLTAEEQARAVSGMRAILDKAQSLA
jgi:N-acetylneuraminate lyase